MRSHRSLAAAALAALAVVLVAAGCGGSSGGTPITIADKGFPENQIIAQLYAKALAAQGFKPTVKSLGSSQIADAAIRRGDIDLYPEYTGTALIVILGMDPDPNDDRAFATISRAYQARGLEVLPPAPFNNDNKVACTEDAVGRYHLSTLSDLGRASPQIVYAANPEHLTRADGLPLLRRFYGVRFKDVRSVDISLRYRPVQQGQAQCVYAFGTDPQVATLHLILLQDDKRIFESTSFRGFPVLNAAYARDAPDSLTRTIEKVDALLTQQAVGELNAKVILDKRDPADVAQEFLTSRGLI
ncbi:MAG: osmoprotectant transport system substrate-binding protein [Miltoncostaeaceae bacterium]|nr:osmoprotectant transport system substrate-binding protein [Miltoncostaeaceae bacterium]